MIQKKMSREESEIGYGQLDIGNYLLKITKKNNHDQFHIRWIKSHKKNE